MNVDIHNHFIIVSSGFSLSDSLSGTKDRKHEGGKTAYTTFAHIYLATYTLLWAYESVAKQPTHCQASWSCRKLLNSSNSALDKTSDTKTYPPSFTMLVMDN